MKGLIIKPKWADLILDGYKNMEIRGRKTNIRGRIGIIKSGTKKVYGTAEIVGCEELNEVTFCLYKNNHMLDISYDELLKIYPKPYAWLLRNHKRYAIPNEYTHKKGCVVWVNL